MNLVKRTSQKGLVLLEIVIGILILGIVLPLLVPNWSEIVGRNISERTIEETLTIWDASRNYYARNSEWPDEANGCADAIAVLEAGGFIGNVGPNNAWDGPISTICVPNTSIFEIEQPVLADWETFILGQLPASQSLAAGEIETIVPAPGTSAQTYSQLSRIAVAGSPELNRMETDLDMDGHDINNLATIEADTVIVNEELTHSVTGDRMSNFSTWDQYTYSTAYAGTNRVPFPSCPSGMTRDLNVMPVAVCTDPSGTLPIERLSFEITTTATGWQVRPEVFAQNTTYRPTSNACSTFKVQTFCE